MEQEKKNQHNLLNAFDVWRTAESYWSATTQMGYIGYELEYEHDRRLVYRHRDDHKAFIVPDYDRVLLGLEDVQVYDRGRRIY